MARFAVGAKTTVAVNSLMPIISLFPTATVVGEVREVGVFNPTTTAFDIRLVRITAGGTVGAALTEACLTNPGDVANCMAFNTHTGGTPTFVDLGYRASIGAAIGAGVIWTIGDVGGNLPATAGTLNGWGVVGAQEGASGTVQICQAYFIWDE